MSEDPTITQLRLADEEILQEMEKTGTNFGEYNALVIKRHKLYLKYEKRATNDSTRYLISTIRQNILTQIKVTVLEEELVKLTIRVDKLEKTLDTSILTTRKRIFNFFGSHSIYKCVNELRYYPITVDLNFVHRQ